MNPFCTNGEIDSIVFFSHIFFFLFFVFSFCFIRVNANWREFELCSIFEEMQVMFWSFFIGWMEKKEGKNEMFERNTSKSNKSEEKHENKMNEIFFLFFYCAFYRACVGFSSNWRACYDQIFFFYFLFSKTFFSSLHQMLPFLMRRYVISAIGTLCTLFTWIYFKW